MSLSVAKTLANELKKDNIDTDLLKVFVLQCETLEDTGHYNDIKTIVFDVITSCSQNKALENSTDFFRLYKLVGRQSKNLGNNRVYQELNKKKRFCGLLEFYTSWAAVSDSVSQFKEILELAKKNLDGKRSQEDIEDFFRSVADEHFPGRFDEDLQLADSTMALFEARPAQKKGRRRSSVAFLQMAAEPKTEILTEKLLGPGTKCPLKREFVNRDDGYMGVSMEEMRMANIVDRMLEESCLMEITQVGENHYRRDSGIVPLKMPEKNQRRRKIEDCFEEEEEVCKNFEISDLDEKRSRHFSPLVPTKEAIRPPLRNSDARLNSREISIIQLSSDTATGTTTNIKTTTVTETRTTDEIFDNSIVLSADTVTAPNKSLLGFTKTDGAASFMEGFHHEARALLSDTVHVGRGAEDKTMGMDSFVTDQPADAPEAEPFDVLCDPDPTMEVYPEFGLDLPKKKISNGLNVVYDEEREEAEPEAPVVQQEYHLPKEFVSPTNDESILQGLDVFKRSSGIVTSTPAVGSMAVSVEDFFAKSAEKKTETFTEEDYFAVPIAQPQFRRRQSLLPPAQPPLPEVIKQKKMPQADESITSSLGAAVSRMSLAGPTTTAAPQTEPEPQLEQKKSAEQPTGDAKRRRSEIITGSINPWDQQLRKRVMAAVRPSTNLHEFSKVCPKLQAMKDVDLGGEVVNIQTLIGQGGYAKVYRGKNEAGETVALKHEVPACAWEVYICEQAKIRMLRSKEKKAVEVANTALMHVIDAYIFTNSSILINQYHEYGTLLDLANRVNDPHWAQTVFIGVQIASILEQLHKIGIIHADIKPDNFMITKRINMDESTDTVLDTMVIKLIDWGRAVDMASLPGRTFTGRAGTHCFDCPEMLDGRPWTYQTDFFGFIGTMIVVTCGKYAELRGSLGCYALNHQIKRRNIARELLSEIEAGCLNVESCEKLPEWSSILEKLRSFWTSKISPSEWRSTASRFNTAAAKHAETT